MRHHGCCFVGPVPLCPFDEQWVRSGETNGFVKKGDNPHEVDMYFGSKCVFHGVSCSRKCC
jgi:hypothetical protein